MESILQSCSLALTFIGVLVVILTRFMKTGFVLTLFGFIGYFYFLDFNNWASMLFIFVGLLLIVLEAFIPDFGLMGMAGIVSFIDGIYLGTSDWMTVIQDVSIAVIVSGLIAVILFKNGLMSNRWDRFVLHSFSPERENIQNPVQATEDKKQVVIGQEGQTLTVCRPTGFAKFTFDDGSVQEVDVTTEISMIEAGVPIKIVNIEGSKIIVRSVN